MRRIWVAGLLGTALVWTGIAEAQIGQRWRERMAQRMEQRQAQGTGEAAAPAPARTIAYGTDPLQQLDLWLPASRAGKAPLVIFVHGGGWKRGSKDNAASRSAPAHFTGLGYAYASINYRLVPAATVEQQAADVAAAVAAMKARAAALGIDPARIVLMGHSAGAHLVALVGTDERYLRGAGLGFADLAGVIPNDGAAYDVPVQMQDGNRFMQSTYVQAFGTDPARQRALSPTLQAAAPNAPRFLLLHVQRPDGVKQSASLADALRKAGTPVEVAGFPGTGLQGHAEINRRLGEPDYPATAVVDRWLKAAFEG